MRLVDWAKEQGLCYRTAWNYFNQGLIPNAYKLPTGTIIVPNDDIEKRSEYTIIYTRVSSSENKNNLDSQAERVSQFCNAKGWIIKETIKEIGSGLNDKRPKLKKILENKNITRIVVEHKDRLTRFGFEYIKSLFDGEIVVINETNEETEDIIQDFVSIITSFCAKIYGKRRSKRKTEKLIEDLKND